MEACLVESTPTAAGTSRSPWAWVPSLYFAQGIPYVVVMTVAVIMFKRLGVSNSLIAFYTSVLYLPWVIKPLWSPFVQRIGTRRSWVLVMQLLVGAGLGCVALSIPAPDFIRYSLAALAFIAVASATHDVAADGFYLLALSTHQQAWFVGIRSTAYRMAMIAGQGLLVMLAGQLEISSGLPVVRVDVAAQQAALQSMAFNPAAFASESSGESQRIVTNSQQVALSIDDRPQAEVDALIAEVRQWNVDHGYTPAVETKAEVDAKSPGWVVRLENWIRGTFGPREAKPAAGAELAGDLAIVYMRLAEPVPAGEEQVVQFGLSSGDPSFKVIEGERFTVNEKNWSDPFASLVQVEAKLDAESSAEFEVRSGNLTFAWSATFFILAGAFGLLCLYHFFALPRPAADGAPADAAASGAFGFIEPFITF